MYDELWTVLLMLQCQEESSGLCHEPSQDLLKGFTGDLCNGL